MNTIKKGLMKHHNIKKINKTTITIDHHLPIGRSGTASLPH